MSTTNTRFSDGLPYQCNNGIYIHGVAAEEALHALITEKICVVQIYGQYTSDIPHKHKYNHQHLLELNRLSDKIQFTIDSESDWQLPFLDTELVR